MIEPVRMDHHFVTGLSSLLTSHVLSSFSYNFIPSPTAVLAVQLLCPCMLESNLLPMPAQVPEESKYSVQEIATYL